jgi:predicted secreted protein
MAAVNGTLLTVDIAGNTVVCETESSMSRTLDMIETTCKASGNSKTYIGGELDGTVEVSGVYDQSGPYDFDSAFTEMEARTEVIWKWGSTASGEIYYTGSALISDLSGEAPKNDVSTWSFTLQMTGAVTSATNA